MSAVSVEAIGHALDELVDHGFLTGWRRERSRFVIEYPGAYRTYSAAEAVAFVDGAHAMGAGTGAWW